MMTSSGGRDEQTLEPLEPLELGRAPVDKLLFGCVLAASAAYVVFLVVMQLAPRAAEGVDKQGYLGVVSGESQPSGLGAGEQDPAAGVAERGGRGSAYYLGNGQPPRPVTLAESSAQDASHNSTQTKPSAPPRRPTRIPATHVQAVASEGGPSSGIAKLGLSDLVLERVEQLAALDLSTQRVDPASEAASALGPAGGALNAPSGHVRVGVGPH